MDKAENIIRDMLLATMLITMIAILYVVEVGFQRFVFTDCEVHNETIEQPAQIESTTDTWDIFIESLIQVESGGNDFIVGDNDDGGCLQLTPIFLAEANEIIGQKGYYKLEDRFDREKSIEIFNVINAYHNPHRDIEKAIRLHNPRAGNEYRDKVMNKYDELLNNKK